MINTDKKLIIGISGPAGSGKSYIAKNALCSVDNILMVENFKRVNENLPQINCEILSLATPIKELVTQLGWNGVKDEKGRKFLQDISKPIKEYNGDDYYAKLLYQKAIKENIDIVIIDDLRFISEVEYFKNNSDVNFVTIRVNRPNVASTLTKEAQADISENDLNNYQFDYYIINNGTNMVEEVDKLINKIIKM